MQTRFVTNVSTFQDGITNIPFLYAKDGDSSSQI